jgi:hypothetical protein
MAMKRNRKLFLTGRVHRPQSALNEARMAGEIQKEFIAQNLAS